MSSSDQDGHPTEPNEAEKQSDADREPNKFRPFRALTYFLRSAQRKYRTKDKRKRLYSFAHDFTIASQDWIALAWQRCKNFFEYAIADIGTGISVSISTFIQILGWFRRGVCRIVNSNRIIAAFTAVMAGTTYFQWQAMERQSEQIQQQLRHSETALGQTDKTLDFMELGQRPWLSVVTPEITEPFQDTKRIQCRMSCKNTGPTPGKIVRHRLATFLLPAITSAEDVLAHYEKIAIEIQEPNTVPPEGGAITESCGWG